LTTVEDLLLQLPVRYEDRSRFTPLDGLDHDVPATIRGRITSARLKRTRVRGFTLFDARVQDPTGQVEARWFNQPYLRYVLKEGSEVVLHGSAVRRESAGPTAFLFKNPHYELLGEDPEGIHTGRIVPIYRRLGDLSTRAMRTFLHRALSALAADFEDPLPEALVRRLTLESRRAAFQHVHFPPSGTSIPSLCVGQTAAHRRLALEELYRLQKSFAAARSLRASFHGYGCRLSAESLKRLMSLTSFELTRGQQAALEAILADLGQDIPMARMLQGDVGCGKTIVALLAALAVMECGHQVAWMAPTEILASQIARQAGKLLEATEHSCALLTSRTRAESGDALRKALEEGSTRLIVGTHALIQEGIRFRSLAFTIVDEQHRFGVRQRDSLGAKGRNPHQLVMTATPIPRSLAMALYGDLDLSVIDEMPSGRTPVRTALRTSSERAKIYRFIREEVKQGGRAAFVVPTVRDSGRTPAGTSALSVFQRLSTTVFPDLGTGLLHGKLPAEERERVMSRFASGQIQVLVATTVLEVGIDVPEASVVVVEQADRFGLAQLHQIRGRVGRGARRSWCILVPSERATPQGTQRLNTLLEVSDGFEIARRDLLLRRSGEFLGLRQSGSPDMKVADLPRDLDLLEIARAEALRKNESPI
jgi:ATP-dependent DNA helicase RecG